MHLLARLCFRVVVLVTLCGASLGPIVPEIVRGEDNTFPGFAATDGVRHAQSDGWIALEREPGFGVRMPQWLSLVQVVIVQFDTNDAAAEGYRQFSDELLTFWWQAVMALTGPDGPSLGDVQSELGASLTEVNVGEDEHFRLWNIDIEGDGGQVYGAIALTMDANQIVLVSALTTPDDEISPEKLEPMPSVLAPSGLATSVAFETAVEMDGAPQPFFPSSAVLGDLHPYAKLSTVYEFDPLLYISQEYEREIAEAERTVAAAKTATAEALRSKAPTGWMAVVDTQGGIRLERADTGEAVAIPFGGVATDPAWSPDGTTLAFARVSDGVSYPGISVFRDGVLTSITNQNCTSPRFTPDSGTLLFACAEHRNLPDDYGLITAVDLATLALHPVVPFDSSQHPVIAFDVRASDGAMLLVRDLQADGALAVDLFDADGGSLELADVSAQFAALIPSGGQGPVSAQFVGDDGILGWVCAGVCVIDGNLAEDAKLYLVQASGDSNLIPVSAAYPFILAVGDGLYVTTNGAYLHLRSADGSFSTLTNGVQLAWQPFDVEIVLPA